MMPMDDARGEVWLLDHYSYDGRTDDGYGPDHPRVGDHGTLLRMADGLPATGFDIIREPRTSLPMLMTDDGGPIPLMDVMLHGWRITLTRRAPGRAVRDPDYDDLYELDPPFEGTTLLEYEDDMDLVDLYTRRIIVQMPITLEDGLREIGYRLADPA